MRLALSCYHSRRLKDQYLEKMEANGWLKCTGIVRDVELNTHSLRASIVYGNGASKSTTHDRQINRLLCIQALRAGFQIRCKISTTHMVQWPTLRYVAIGDSKLSSSAACNSNPEISISMISCIA